MVMISFLLLSIVGAEAGFGIGVPVDTCTVQYMIQ